MAEPSAKRPRLNKRGEDDYLPGNITEIELHNFMTFSQLKCKPGPRLNLVIGPNGSGKSSLVCAIALGLGGEPQLLGRASSVGAFVKRGEVSGFVRISLRGDSLGEQLTITRKIDKSNKSEWMFNGKVVPKRDIHEIIRRFNIQVNNLTQFLPQDRVCEFAKLTPVQLLEETEKAVGDPQLPVQHRTLIDKSRDLKRLEVTVKQNGDTLNQLKALNAEQEKDVQRVRQREQLLAKVESMKKKLPWLKYDKVQVHYKEAQKDENDAKRVMDEAAKVLRDLNVPIEKQKKLKEMQDAACRNVSKLIAKNNSKRLESLENENCLGVQVGGRYNEMEELRRQEESRQNRLVKAKEDLASAEVELTNLPNFEPPKSELDNLTAQIAELDMSAKQKVSQKKEQENNLLLQKRSLLQSKEKLRDMENKNNKLLQALQRSGAEHIFEAYRWVQEHRHEFSEEVYGPVLLEVNVQNRDHAAYLENHVANYIWKAFITQNAADRDFLVHGLKPFAVPVLNVTNRVHNKDPYEITEEMHKLGIYSRLDHVFDAPSAVKEVLISQSGLDKSYIGSKDTDQKADRVPQLGISDLWTPDNHYRWSVSRYGGHVSASVEPVSPSRLFLCSVDTGEIENLRSRTQGLEETISAIEGSFKSLQNEQRRFEDEAAKLRKQREDLVNTVQLEKKKRRDMENRVVQRKRKLESIWNEHDMDTNMKILIDQVSQLNMQRFQNAIEMKNMLVETVSLKRSYAEKHIASIELEAKIWKLKQNVKDHEKVALQASMQFEECKKKTERFREQLTAAKRHAESIAKITPELTKEFLEMPGTIEELEAAIQDNISQANSILFLNHNVLEEYENRQRKIEAISTKLEADDSELKRCLAEIDSLKESWLLTLRNLVSHINETFSRNFQEMAVAGEVSLDEHEMDFDKFGVLIKVKFRQAGELQVLSAHHQSGGERSVSTILYLVSLQDITNCPFRVVDEINQGMDPINERKMFQQLVRAASQPNSPQCFLLTPKLLPDLEYSEACSILNMINGPWIEKPSKVWSDGERWGQIVGLA